MWQGSSVLYDLVFLKETFDKLLEFVSEFEGDKLTRSFQNGGGALVQTTAMTGTLKKRTK